MEFGKSIQERYEQAVFTAREAFDELSEAVSDAGEKIADGAEYVKAKTQQGIEYAADKIIAAKEKVDDYLSPKPAGQSIVPCPLGSKAQRVAQRKQKISQAKEKIKTMPSGTEKTTLENATSRFEFNNKAVERARLAENAYEIGQGEPPAGWKRVSADKIEALGLDPDDFPQIDADFDPDDYKDGFFVDFYKTDPEVFEEEKYVLAYRGTQGKGQDWKTNALQSIGKETEHYKRAMNVAKKAKKKLGEKLEITGHSLGGGMATAAGIVSRSKTYAFNPAGVHPATLERAGYFSREDAFKQVNGQPLVDNVVIPGELLTGLQSPGLQREVMLASAAVAPVATIAGLSRNRAFREQGTLSYGMAGVRHDVPLLGNAHEVAEALAKGGEPIQGMTPSKAGQIRAAMGPLKKIDMHSMPVVIAGIEQQKADDLNIIDHPVK